MYFYKIYGLNVASYKRLYGIPEVNLNLENISVEILQASLEHLSDELKSENKWIKTSPSKTFFKVSKLGMYCIENGNKILIDTPNANNNALDGFILGLAFCLLLSQKNQIALHGASVLLNDNKSIIIVGRSGAGKSTLTSNFVSKGFKFLCDDISVISKDKDQYYIESGFPYRKIRSDAMENLNYSKDKFESIGESGKKYAIIDTSNFCANKVPITYLCEITVSDNENSDVSIEEIFSFDKMNLITRHIFGSHIFFRNGIDKTYADKLVDVSSKIRCFKLTRARNKFSVDKQIDLITSLL